MVHEVFCHEKVRHKLVLQDHVQGRGHVLDADMRPRYLKKECRAYNSKVDWNSTFINLAIDVMCYYQGSECARSAKKVTVDNEAQLFGSLDLPQ